MTYAERRPLGFAFGANCEPPNDLVGGFVYGRVNAPRQLVQAEALFRAYAENELPDALDPAHEAYETVFRFPKADYTKHIRHNGSPKGYCGPAACVRVPFDIDRAGNLEVALDDARNSDRTYRGLSGNDRYHLYLLASGSGFRASALANLTPANFDIDGRTVTLPARFNKSRKTKVQPLPEELVTAFRSYLAEKPTGSPVWGGTWAQNTAEMLRIDLEAAGIPYATEGPDGPEFTDFHSLRHSFLTELGRNGVDLRTAQELAGHSTPELTARYSHRRLYDLQGAGGKLPTLAIDDPQATDQAATAERMERDGTRSFLLYARRRISPCD